MHVNVFNLVVVLRSQATHCLPIWLGMVLCNGVTVVLPWGFSPFLNSIHPPKKTCPYPTPVKSQWICVSTRIVFTCFLHTRHFLYIGSNHQFKYAPTHPVDTWNQSCNTSLVCSSATTASCRKPHSCSLLVVSSSTRESHIRSKSQALVHI